MNNIKVSVIIPVYNAENFLDECLVSICNQSLREIEIICVDDGSTDFSGNILTRYADKDTRIKIISQLNKGVSAARNTGLRNACGEYITFVDADDYIDVNMLNKLYISAQKDNAEIVVFGGDVVPVISPENEWVLAYLNVHDKFYSAFDPDILFNKSGAIPFMCNKFYNHKFLLENKLWLNETLKLGEDQAFQFIAFPCAKRILFLSDKFYHYRALNNQSTVYKYAQMEKRKCKQHLKMLEVILNEWSQRDFLEELRNKFAYWMLQFMYIDICRMRTINKYVICRKTIKIMKRYNLVQEWRNNEYQEMYRYIKGFSKKYIYFFELTKAIIKKFIKMVKLYD